ncbi:MAG: polysaccharide biosynthesis tyrosine autokinase [Spirochaetales bacterium]|jgi:capsular exopolysaccharide synthesis family protein
MNNNNNNDTINFSENDSYEPSFREVFFKYIRHWKWFLLSLIISIGLSYLYIRLSTPQYKLETDLLIKDNKGNLGGTSDLLKDLDLFSSDKIIDNEIQILKSNTILEKVVKGLNLQTSYYSTKGVRLHEVYENLPLKVQLFNAGSGFDYTKKYVIRLLNKNEVAINGKKYPVNKPILLDLGTVLVTTSNELKIVPDEDFQIKFDDIRDVIDRYSNKINISPVSKQGTVLIITLEDAIPQKGKDILNRLVFEYNKAAIDDKNQVTSTTLAFITDRLNKLQEELGTAEKKVENYKSGNQITDISSQSQIFLQSVKDNDTELNKVNIQLNVIKSIEKYISSSAEGQTQLPSMLGIDDPTLLALVSQLGEAELKKQSYLQTIPENNPIVTSVNDQIRALKSTINQSVQNLKNSLIGTKSLLTKTNSSFQSIISQVPAKERGLIDVMRQQEIKNNLFTYLLQKREESEISLASTAADSRIIDEARSTKQPVKPVKQLTFITFMLFGIIIPAVIIYFQDLLNFKISKRSDIERVTKVPILAEISHSDDSSPLLVASKPRSMVAEQLRALRTNLNFVIPNKEDKVILFTSSISGEGKSFISLNLGASLALSGKKVVILELDLRKPKLHAGLEIDNTKGLSNYLIGQVTEDEILKSIEQQENYYIITSGPIPPNPAELLVNGKIEVLIEKLKSQFDYIILDAPPVGLVTDAQILSEFANTTLFIVRHNYTAKANIVAIDNLFRSKKFKNLNILINSIEVQGGGYGYGYGYGYSYGYGGYYQEEEPTKKSFLSRKSNKTK